MCVYTNTEKGECFLASYPEQVDVDIWASKPTGEIYQFKSPSGLHSKGK